MPPAAVVLEGAPKSSQVVVRRPRRAMLVPQSMSLGIYRANVFVGSKFTYEKVDATPSDKT